MLHSHNQEHHQEYLGGFFDFEFLAELVGKCNQGSTVKFGLAGIHGVLIPERPNSQIVGASILTCIT